MITNKKVYSVIVEEILPTWTMRNVSRQGRRTDMLRYSLSGLEVIKFSLTVNHKYFLVNGGIYLFSRTGFTVAKLFTADCWLCSVAQHLFINWFGKRLETHWKFSSYSIYTDVYFDWQPAHASSSFYAVVGFFQLFFLDNNEALDLLRKVINFLAETFNTPQENFQNCSGKEERKIKENGYNL